MPPPTTDVPPVSAWLDAVVLVRQGSATCAGARVDAEHVLTAYHCVAPGGRPSIEARDGDRVVGRVRFVDRAADLAVIEAPGDGPWLPIASALPALGAPVWALGHPGGGALPAGFYAGTLRWSASEGVVAAVGARALQVTTPIDPGSSGGPLVDGDGRVVGVVSRKLVGEGLGFAARAEDVPERMAAVPPHGLSPFGGTWGGELLVSSQDATSGGTVSLGARLEVAFRDRLVLQGAGMVPLSDAFAAARFGEVVASVGEGTAGLRQRLGRGPWAVRVDAFGGLAAVQTVSRPDAAAPLDLDREVAPAPVVGGAVRVRAVGFELAVLPEQGLVRSSAILRWPGVVGVF